MKQKFAQKYLFAIEGDTEKYYLEWLAKQINNTPNATSKCTIPSPQKGKDPSAIRRYFNNLYKETVYYLIDKECYNDEDEFKEFLRKLTPTKREKSIVFQLGYSNISFELWILLHKTNFSKPVEKPKDYLKHINKAFNFSFKNLEQYKKETNFKNLLSKLTLDDVINAIERAYEIQGINKQACKQESFCKYEYYKENPSLSIHEIIDKILKDCGIYQKCYDNNSK